MLYLDTSLLVTAMTPEPMTHTIQAWPDRNARETFAVSEWVTTEFAAALSVKVRSDKITPEQRRLAMLEFGYLVNDTAEMLPVAGEHFRLAAQFADQSRIGLRAGDALHLAVAKISAANLCTRDKRLANASSEFGVSTILL